jgi:hypothetical protein
MGRRSYNYAGNCLAISYTQRQFELPYIFHKIMMIISVAKFYYYAVRKLGFRAVPKLGLRAKNVPRGT